MASYEQILTRVIGEYQASNDSLRAQLAAAHQRIRELEGLTPEPSDTGASTPTEG